uniref:G_PROTEIN_RECEP_F1_2 domain-containing protein n=1 Tax=Angiostrongylus cantonensis TaxID=6313 RepID=A0A158P7K3_ANGCA
MIGSIGSVTVFQVLKGSTLFLLVIWTIFANTLVFVVLYKNPHLQTVPNLLVGNLAFSDLCLALIVLPLSSVYAIAGEWVFPDTLCEVFVSADILCSTASIWNLSIVGLDRYWAIASPVAYMTKRNKRTAGIMILSVWFSSALISLAPLLGWKQTAITPNLIYEKNRTIRQCTFLDLPSYTVYSATGSFFIPTILMFFVYFKIYRAFAKHRARQIYRQKVNSAVIRKHIESTILHEISHVLPTSDEFAKEEEDDSEGSGQAGNGLPNGNDAILEESEEESDEKAEDVSTARLLTNISNNLFIFRAHRRLTWAAICQSIKFGNRRKERVRHKSLQRKPKAISAAKERRGVTVLGIILGCFTICWAPFFVMYVLVQFCKECSPNPHIEMFITWLGYSNSAMNPIIYTVFNRDYQIALKKLFSNERKLGSSSVV